jgi:hypothetical protein
MLQNCDLAESNYEVTTTVRDFFLACKTWQDCFDKMKAARSSREQKKTDGQDDLNMPVVYSDLNPYIENVIMVDGLDEQGTAINTNEMESLRLAILTYLTTSLPCVALGTLRHGEDGWKDSASLVQANIPVLYIDVRNHDNYDEACKSIPKIDASGSKTMMSLDERMKVVKKIHSAMETDCSMEWDELSNVDKYDVLDVCRIAFMHTAYHTAIELKEDVKPIHAHNAIQIHEAIKQLKRDHQSSDDANAEVRFYLNKVALDD